MGLGEGSETWLKFLSSKEVWEIIQQKNDKKDKEREEAAQRRVNLNDQHAYKQMLQFSISLGNAH